MFSADRVLEVLARVPNAVVDGGWGVDALVGRETRPHDDLDLVVPLADLESIVAALAPVGYELHVDELPTRVVLADGEARVDLHLVSPSDFGMVQTLPGGRRFTYVFGETTGTIERVTVRCLSAPMQVLTHAGYEPDADDRADMAVVAAHSGEALPPPYVPLDDLQLRPATVADLAAVMSVRRRSWVAAYTGRMPQEIIDALDVGESWLHWSSALRIPALPSFRMTVAGAPGAVHGFSVVSACRDGDASDDVGEVRLLYVDPTAWGAGAGAALLRHAEDTLHGLGFDELRLWTLRENDRARAFYERQGWKADGAVQTIDQPAGSYVEVRYRT